MQESSLLASHRSSSGKKLMNRMEKLPKVIQNEIHSHITPAEDLFLRMSLPASDYKPNSSLALVLNVLFQDGGTRENSSLYRNSLNKKDIAALPTIYIQPQRYGMARARDIFMLLNLPEGRLEQITMLLVHYSLDNICKVTWREDPDVTESLKGISFALKNVKRLSVIISRGRGQTFDDKYPNLLPLEYEFNLTESDDSCTSVICVLKHLFFFPLDETRLENLKENLRIETPKCVLKDALFCVTLRSEESLSIIHRFPEFRWQVEGPMKYLTEATKKLIKNYRSLSDKSPIDLSEFPNIEALDTSCKISSPNGFSSNSLVSLSIVDTKTESMRQLFALNLPELRVLSIREGNRDLCLLKDPLLFPFPKLVDLELNDISHVTIDMGNMSIKFIKLSLIKFSGKIIRSENLHIDNLLLDGSCFATLVFFFEPMVYQLSSRASRTELILPFNETVAVSRFCDALLEKAKDIIIIGSPYRIGYDLTIPDVYRASSFTTLQLSYVCITISPVMFPCLETIVLKGCNIRFCSGIEDEIGGLDFSNLVVLSLTGSKTVHTHSENCMEDKRHFKSSSYRFFHASRMKMIFIDGLENHDYLIFSSLYCGEVEIIYWVYCLTSDSHMPFTVNEPDSICFSKLRTLSVKGNFTYTHEGKRPGIELTFPLANVSALHLLGDIVVPNFNQMKLTCQNAVFSARFVELNFQGNFEFPIRYHRSWILKKREKQIRHVMPNAEVLVVEDWLSFIEVNIQPPIIHVKRIMKKEKRNSPHGGDSSSRAFSDFQYDHWCGCCFFTGSR